MSFCYTNDGGTKNYLSLLNIILMNSFIPAMYFSLMIVLISDWKFLGGWENDETVEEAAKREAVEEAGVRGELMVNKLIPLSFWMYFIYPNVQIQPGCYLVILRESW